MIDEFPASIHEQLQHYVYLYIDPRSGEVFYVGKGNRNRAFSHLREESEKAKVERIKDIKADGQEPRIDILVHGLDDETAKRVEASVIDLLGVEKLTNLVRGYDSREYGRMSIEQVVATYGAEKASIHEPSILININRSFRYGMPAVELYDATRSAWVVGKRKDAAKYGMAIYQGIIQEVYEIQGWYKANSTFNTRKPEGTDINEDRWEFVGRLAGDDLRHRYRFKDVSEHIGGQNPIKYLNC